MTAVTNASPLIVLAKINQFSLLPQLFTLARTQAHRLQLAVKGTVGILLAGYYAGIVQNLKKSLDELRAHNFRLSDTIYHSVLAHVKPSIPS